MRIRERLQNEDGISLVELLVSMVVLAVVMMGLLSTSMAALASVRSSEQRIRATALVNEILENAQAIAFNDLTFHYLDTFPAGPAPAERVVLTSGSRPTRAPLPEETVTRGGMTYDVTREIVWVDNPLTGSDEDYKRITVTVTWDSGGTERQQVAEALRASENQQSDFVLTAFNVSETVVYIDSAGNAITSPVDLTATTSEQPDPDPYVKVSFTDRDGVDRVVNMTPAGDNDFELALPSYPYRNGDTNFTFTAERDGEDVLGQKLVRFLQPLAIDTVFDPTFACAEDGAYAPAVDLLIHVEGTVEEDEVTVSWPGNSGTAEYDPARTDERGAGFLFTIPEGTYTATMAVRVDVLRMADSHSDSENYLFELNPEACAS